MKKKLIKEKIILTIKLIFITIFLFTMAGCGKNPEIENYRANMEQFFENVKIFDSSINAIDPDSETAVIELLSLLDSMNTSFSQMASLEVPDGFPGVEQLADEASAYMSEAVSYYHQAYDGEFNASLEDAARQNYERANVRLQYIRSIFQGDIPEEIYTYEDDTEDSSGDSEPAAEE